MPHKDKNKQNKLVHPSYYKKYGYNPIGVKK